MSPARATGALCVALLSVVLPAAARAQMAALRILDAQYGDARTSRLCDATHAIATLCDGQAACSIPVGNALCGDPAYGTPKRLQMAFKCDGGVPELVIAPEPNTVRLACPAARGSSNRT